MSTADLNNFFKALDAEKQDYTCGVCSEMCKNPVTLSKCFHLICGEHFEGLEACPTCNASLEGCSIYSCDGSSPAIKSAKEIDKLFENFRPKVAPLTKADSAPPKSSLKRVKGIESDKIQPKHKASEKKIHKPTKVLSEKKNQGKKPELNITATSSTNVIARRLGKDDKITELLNQGANLELAEGAMKEALIIASENIVQTQTVNITLTSNSHSELDFDNIRVYCVTMFRTVQNKLKKLSKHHNNFHIEPKFTKKVTHLIVDADDDRVCPTTLDILQGIVYGVWILSSNWIMKSTKDQIEPFDRYEIVGVGSQNNNGPKNARYNKYKQLPGIFDGCHFYLHNGTTFVTSKQIVVTKAILKKLIIDAGGIVLRRLPNPESVSVSKKLGPYHAKKDGELVKCSHYIIFKDLHEPMYNMEHLKSVPIAWLIECIEKYELCEPVVYHYM